jgi:hypothetical protein
MSAGELTEILTKAVAEWAANGILQRKPAWYTHKKYTIGGSSLAAIQGVDHFKSFREFVYEKLFPSEYMSKLAPQWGTLFEEIIKQVVESAFKCTVLGEDIYVSGDDAVAYSPDGLAVISGDLLHQLAQAEDGAVINEYNIALLEFKCPYSRIPNGRMPAQYIPQVKMGLDYLGLPTVGLYAEAVFRRCRHSQLGYNVEYDKDLVARSSGRLPLARGFIGFYYDETAYNQRMTEVSSRESYDKKRTDILSWSTWDAADASKDDFDRLMDACDCGVITPWYSAIAYGGSKTQLMEDFVHDVRGKGGQPISVMAWKLFRVDYHVVRKTSGYLDAWRPTINNVISLVRECESMTMSQKITKLGEFMQAHYGDTTDIVFEDIC